MFILVIEKIDIFDGSGFRLTELMSRNHFKATLSVLSYVDHDPPALLDCVFCFLLAMTVVNIQNGGAYFCAIPKLDALSARRNIAREFIYNRYLIVDIKKASSSFCS